MAIKKVGNIGENEMFSTDAPTTIKSSIDQSTRTLEAGQQFNTGEWSVFDPLKTTDNSIVDSTKGIRDQENINKYDASELYGSSSDIMNTYDKQLETILGQTPYGQTEVGMAGQGELDELRRSLGIQGTEDEYAMGAGERAYGEYAPLIADAEKAKQYGMPKATIRGGERGGFMSTQFAGGAALQETEGGDFAGAGGELEEIKSAYDTAIYNIKAKANSARLGAEAAAREAYRTGKEADYKRAREAYADAKAQSQEAIDMANGKVDAINSYIQTSQSMVDYQTGLEDTAKEDAANQLNYYMDNFGLEYIEQNYDQISQLLEDSGFEGADLDTMIETMRSQRESDNANTFKMRLDANGNLVQYELDANEQVVGEKTISKKAQKATGGGGGGGDDKDIEKFNSEAADWIEKLDEVDEYGENTTLWRTAFDALKTKFPNASNELINDKLKGGIPYSEKEGFDTSKAWGRAKIKED